MRGQSVGGWLVLLIGGTVLLSLSPGRAAEPAHGGKVKYSALIHRDKLEVEKDFDVSRPEELEELTAALRNGEVAELQGEKEINILDISWDLGLWTAVVFVLLLLVLRRLAWDPMLKGLQRRESNIREALAEAQRAREDAQRIRVELQGEMDRASGKVRDLLDEARRDAQQATEEMISKTRAEIQTERDRLRREIETARDQALHELWNRTADLATMVSSKALRRQMNADDHRRLVDEAIAEMREAGAERQRQVVSVQP